MFSLKRWIIFSSVFNIMLIPRLLHAQEYITLNELKIGIDTNSGAILSLSYPATGAVSETTPDKAGLLDVAYPIAQFAPMRFASRFSQAQIVREPKSVTIIYNHLGSSRSNFNLPAGDVAAKITIKSAPNGKSVILSCRIENHSASPIPQILFPDLWGFKPFDGVEQTQLRLAGGATKPFAEPIPSMGPLLYYDRGLKEYPPCGYYGGMNSLRWTDFGSLKGGLSIFQRKWGEGDIPTLRTLRKDADLMSLRMFWEHRDTIEPNQSWESGEFWLTPHRGGWAKGIEVFREYVEQVCPPRELPKHVKDGLGFQTIWMIQSIEKDPNKAAFRFSDIPRVAKDAVEHGIDELQIWGYCNYFTLPITVRSELGTKGELVDGIRKARQLGVNVGLFNSIQIVHDKYAKRYDGTPGTAPWTFHPEFMPNFNPYYSKSFSGTMISSENKAWQEDVKTALLDMIDSGMPSMSWDGFDSKVNIKGESELVALIGRIREQARAKDPQSTFAAESCFAGGLEREGRVVDYTWCWVDYVEVGPIMNVLRSPRLNCIVEDSPLVVKKAFCDGLYLCLIPKQPDMPNGTALISDFPLLSRAVKEAAALRKQFLPYFTEGRVLGNSTLCEPVPVFVSAHQFGRKLLLICLNDTSVIQSPKITCDLALWLPQADRYRVTYYDDCGKKVREHTAALAAGAEWNGKTDPLQPLEMAFFEIETTGVKANDSR